MKPSARQVGKLHEGMVLSSPVAQAVAGHYRRTQGKDALSTDVVAQKLADALNNRQALNAANGF